MTSGIFIHRPEAGGSGDKYEYLIAGLYSFTLSISEKVEDFKISVNNNDMGNFDDVILEIKFTDGEEYLYALQLKHRDAKATSITLQAFTADKGKFGLGKYYKGFQETKAACKDNLKYSIPFENFRFILYTNELLPKFTDYDKKSHQKVFVDEIKLSNKSNVTIFRHDQCVAKNLINLCEEDKYYIYKFRTNEDMMNEFLNQFVLYTKQKNVEEIECMIGARIREVFGDCEMKTVTDYMNFFKCWWRGDFGSIKLTKKDVLLKITEYVLTPHIPNVDFTTLLSYSDKKYILLQKCFLKFDVTMVENSTETHTENKIWTTLLLKIFNKFHESWLWSQPISNLENDILMKIDNVPVSALDENSVDKSPKKMYIILWHMNAVPLLIRIHDHNKKGIFRAIRLVSDLQSGKKFIILYEKCVEEEYGKNLVVLKNLSDLVVHDDLYRRICKHLNISLQGRQCLNIEKLIDIDNNFLKIITAKEIIRMYGELCTVGKDCMNNLPKYYIARRTPKVILDAKVLSEVKNEVFVFQEPKDKTFKDICSSKQSNNFHHIRKIDNERVEWIKSEGNIDSLRGFQLKLMNLKKEDFIQDAEILNYFKNNINIVCTKPGMGKSVMLKFVETICFSTYWVISIDLCKHIKFFKKSCKSEELIQYISQSRNENTFTEKVIDILVSKRKILFLWDALDALPKKSLNLVISLMKDLKNKDYRQWITARSNLKEFLENTFSLLSLTITHLNQQDERELMYKNLNDRYEGEEEIKVLADKLEKSIALLKQYGFYDYSGTPLQVRTVVEVYLKNPQKYRGEFISVFLIDIFQELIDEKFEIFFKNANTNKNNLSMKYVLKKFKKSQLTQYEIAAAQTSFDEETFSGLNLNCDDFLEEIKEDKDNLGIIYGLNVEGKPIFIHKIYEEFLTASWIFKNYKNHPDLINILYQNKYKNIKMIFDMLLTTARQVEFSLEEDHCIAREEVFWSVM